MIDFIRERVASLLSSCPGEVNIDAIVKSNDGDVTQTWPGADKPIIVVHGGSDTEGYCPTGDFECPGL